MDIRTLTTRHTSEVQALFEATPQYFLNTAGKPAAANAAEESLTIFPSGISHEPILLGAYREGELLGLLIAAVGFPSRDHAHCGLLLVRADMQAQGVGRLLHSAYVERIRALETVTTLRLSVVTTNAVAAEPFWLRLGYMPTGERKPYRNGTVVSEAIVFERPLIQTDSF